MTTLQIPVSSSDHIQGNTTAPVILVEYGDYECPYCGKAHHVIKQLQKYFGPNLGFVFRHFPLVEVHPHAEIAAETAEFTNSHHRFWEMHDLLYENQNNLSMLMLFDLAKALALPISELQDALQARRYYPKIQSDFLGGVKSGVNGTPTFFINNERYNGSWELADLREAIEEEE